MAAGHPVIEVDGFAIPTDSMCLQFGDEKWLEVDRRNRRYHCRFGEGHLKNHSWGGNRRYFCRFGEGYQKIYTWGGRSSPNLQEAWETACTSLGVAAYSSDTKARVEQARSDAPKRLPSAVVVASSSADMEGVIVPTTYKKIRDRLKLLYLVLGFAGPAPFD